MAFPLYKLSDPAMTNKTVNRSGKHHGSIVYKQNSEGNTKKSTEKLRDNSSSPLLRRSGGMIHSRVFAVSTNSYPESTKVQRSVSFGSGEHRKFHLGALQGTYNSSSPPRSCGDDGQRTGRRNTRDSLSSCVPKRNSGSPGPGVPRMQFDRSRHSAGSSTTMMKIVKSPSPSPRTSPSPLSSPSRNTRESSKSRSVCLVDKNGRLTEDVRVGELVCSERAALWVDREKILHLVKNCAVGRQNKSASERELSVCDDLMLRELGLRYAGSMDRLRPVMKRWASYGELIKGKSGIHLTGDTIRVLNETYNIAKMCFEEKAQTELATLNKRALEYICYMIVFKRIPVYSVQGAEVAYAFFGNNIFKLNYGCKANCTLVVDEQRKHAYVHASQDLEKGSIITVCPLLCYGSAMQRRDEWTRLYGAFCECDYCVSCSCDASTKVASCCTLYGVSTDIEHTKLRSTATLPGSELSYFDLLNKVLEDHGDECKCRLCVYGHRSLGFHYAKDEDTLKLSAKSFQHSISALKQHKNKICHIQQSSAIHSAEIDVMSYYLAQVVSKRTVEMPNWCKITKEKPRSKRNSETTTESACDAIARKCMSARTRSGSRTHRSMSAGPSFRKGLSLTARNQKRSPSDTQIAQTLSYSELFIPHISSDTRI